MSFLMCPAAHKHHHRVFFPASDYYCTVLLSSGTKFFMNGPDLIIYIYIYAWQINNKIFKVKFNVFWPVKKVGQ